MDPSDSSPRSAARSLSSRFCLWARAVPFDPGESSGCAYPLLDRWCWLGPIRRIGHSHWCNEAELGSLIATARAFAFRGFMPGIAPATRPVRYMANGSFQGKLLSAYETETGFTDAPNCTDEMTSSRIWSVKCVGSVAQGLCAPPSPRGWSSAWHHWALFGLNTAGAASKARCG
jgi:hypothetical protein